MVDIFIFKTDIGVMGIKNIKRIFSGHFTQLIVFLLLLFIFRPFDVGMAYNAVWQLIFIGVLVTAVFNCHHPKKIKILAIFLGIPAIVFTSWIQFEPLIQLIIAARAFTVLFLLTCTISILINVVLRARVTVETLRGAICAYFLIGFVFAYVYVLIEAVRPGSFRFLPMEVVATSGFYVSQLMYFSFVTLLAIGYGDITAIGDLGQTCVIMEGVAGQFYLAILVARLVSVYSIFSQKKLIQEIEHLEK